MNRLTFSNAKWTKTTIVYREELNKLGIQNFSISDDLGFQKLVCRRRNLKITNLNHPNYLKWKVGQTTIVDLDEFNKLGIQNF